MKKTLVFSLIVVSVMAFATFAGPTITLRTWPGETIVPSFGVQYAGDWSPYIEVTKTNMWAFTRDGIYAVDGGVAIPFMWGGTPLKVPIGVVLPVEVDTGPLTFSVDHAYGLVGLWIDGGHGRAIRAEALYDNRDWTFSLGVQVDLHGLWLMAFPEVSKNEAKQS